MSLNANATPAAREPGPPVTRCRSLTAAKVGSIGEASLQVWIRVCCASSAAEPSSFEGEYVMGVFVSYSSRDREAVKSLTQDLQDAEEQVWLDQRLAGGDAWWRAILDQIRGCDVFIFALSQNSIQSKPCQAELHYAQSLGLPILPVQVGPVDSMQLNPLATVQSVDYRNPVGSTGMRLIAALNRARAQRQPLPSPLPDEPAVPFEYLIRLYTIIAGPDQLSPRDQAALVAQLELGLREDGDHDVARKDVVTLLTKLRDREDVTYRTRTDVDAILAAIGSESRPEPGPRPLTLSTAPATSETVGGELTTADTALEKPAAPSPPSTSRTPHTEQVTPRRPSDAANGPPDLRTGPTIAPPKEQRHTGPATVRWARVMIVLGIILTVLGLSLPTFVPTFAFAHICFLIGIILLVVGLLLMVAGRMGHAVGRRGHN
jgi:hypothetical protein